jgi:hypothetical protein
MQLKGDEIYPHNKDALEKDHLGELVAIDIETNSIVGIGKTIEDVHKQASEKVNEKRKFYLRRIGTQAAIYRVR